MRICGVGRFIIFLSPAYQGKEEEILSRVCSKGAQRIFPVICFSNRIASGAIGQKNRTRKTLHLLVRCRCPKSLHDPNQTLPYPHEQFSINSARVSVPRLTLANKSLSEKSHSMVLKRALQEERSDHLGVLSPELKRRPNHGKSLFWGFQADEIISRLQPWLESFFSETIGEEVDRAISRFHNRSARPSFNLAGNSGRCSLQLRFVKMLPPILYSKINVEADDGTPLQIKLVDCTTGETVMDGPLSSMRVEIVVVGNGFRCDDEREDWSVEEFNKNIVREREGRSPLLAGDTRVSLKGGVGALGGLTFTDNSSWTRSKKFRLGVRVVSKTSPEARVMEAISNSFSVKDHRGEKYKKHHPPYLFDEVWRLEQIRKGGTFHARLSSQGIETVKDFLQRYEVNPSALRNILGPGICSRTWDTIVGHAKDCIIDDNERYTYYFASENISLMFNSVCKFVGAAFGSLDYQPVDSLTPHQNVLVQSLRTQALKKIDEWLPVDVALDGTLNLSQNEPSIDFNVLSQFEQEVFPALNILSASYNYEAMGSLQPEIYPPAEVTSPFHVFDTGQDVCIQGESGYNSHATSTENFSEGYQSYPWLPASSTRGAGQASFVGSGLKSSRSSLTSLKTEAST